MIMPTWIIEPRDPLIVRDGRPFGPQPGARAVSLGFPFPSTTAGGLRTRAGSNTAGYFDAKPEDVKGIAVQGPLLIELDMSGQIIEWLTPAPADALLLTGRTDNRTERRRLVPLRRFEGATTDGPIGLSLVGLPTPDPRKPVAKPPRFWHWDVFERWLTDPPLRDEQVLASLGHDGPRAERRMHVSIDPTTRANVREALFQTSGLEFTRCGSEDELGTARRLALAVCSDTPKVTNGLAPLGGERRLVAWRESARGLPACPEDVRRQVSKQGCCRIILLTPAYFKEGSRPTWLRAPLVGVTPELKAAAMPRAHVVSGWDFEKKRPKPTRRVIAQIVAGRRVGE